MDLGFCVLGLEASKAGFRSLRPIPPYSTAWRSFPYRRTDRVAFDLSALPVTLPHVEDRLAANHHKLGSITEGEFIRCLKQAEVGRSLEELFDCHVHPSPRGGDAVYVKPDEAKRSICGCKIDSISFSFRFYPPKIRVALALESGETLASLPIVDRDWYEFASHLKDQMKDSADVSSGLDDFFNSFIENRILSSAIRFARIGLARPSWDGHCWLMLDSLFPLPRREWQEEFE